MYIVKYSGPFGYIKPWTAVRDELTFSQQFLTQSILEGIEKKLFPALLETTGIQKIFRHRLTYLNIVSQQEQTQPRSIIPRKKKLKQTEYQRPKSILTRGVLINPKLFLGFQTIEDAEIGVKQHICLCRNEDVLLPNKKIIEVTEEEFDKPENGFNGFELIPEKSPDSFLVGFNRFRNSEAMYGRLLIVGNNPLINSENYYEST